MIQINLLSQNSDIVLSPMLGITDVAFRSAFSHYFSGFDYAIAPFIKLTKFGTFKKSKFLELDPQKNTKLAVVPQIMTNNPKVFIEFCRLLADEFGYENVNWNLGCPSPTSAGRGMGCGLMAEPDLVDQILEEAHSSLDIKISVKARIGYKSTEESIPILKVFNRYPLKQLIIHPRTGEQGYKGEVNLSAFEYIYLNSTNPLGFSGDIKKNVDILDIRARFPQLSSIFIGRGILGDPWMVESLRTSGDPRQKDLPRYIDFLRELGNLYLEKDYGLKQTLLRLKNNWSYFADHNNLPMSLRRKIRKSKCLESFLANACPTCHKESIK